MKILIISLILIMLFILSISTTFAAEPPAISSIEPPDPLLLIYQELKIGIERQKVYDIVNKYYPGHMAVIHPELDNYETWHWNWPPETKKFSENSVLRN